MVFHPRVVGWLFARIGNIIFMLWSYLVDSCFGMLVLRILLENGVVNGKILKQ